MNKFGRHLRPLWHLEAGSVFLNHGSFGACPIEVLAAQSRVREMMERQPDQYFRRSVSPLNPNNLLRQSAERLASIIGTVGSRLAFVTNPTEAINTVLRSLSLKSGDEILVLDCVYNAVRMAVEEKCRESGAHMVMVSLPLPLTANDVVGRIADAAGPNTRLAIIDHIASATAILFPVAEITRALHDKGVRVMIDGAHVLGQIALDLNAIGADWYTATAHKWFYSPKGTAFLYANEEAAAHIRPLSISHYYNDGFPLAFDYIGTRDVSAYLSVPAAMTFIERFGAQNIQSYLQSLSREGCAVMSDIGALPAAVDSMYAAMRTYVLPQKREALPEDAQWLINTYWDKHRIQIAAFCFQGKLLLRLSAQIYLERADFEELMRVLKIEGWPAR